MDQRGLSELALLRRTYSRNVAVIQLTAPHPLVSPTFDIVDVRIEGSLVESGAGVFISEDVSVPFVVALVMLWI